MIRSASAVAREYACLTHTHWNPCAHTSYSVEARLAYILYLEQPGEPAKWEGLTMQCKVLAFCVAVSWICPGAAPNAQPQAVELFEASRLLDAVTPKFPASASMRGEEGWVIVNFMIDEAGQAFEPMVVDSMGDNLFIDAALTALDDSTFVPASLSGKAINSSKTIRYTFVLENREKGARRSFTSRYRRFIRFVDDDEQEKAQAELERLEENGARSLYEDAFLNLARYYYAAEYGSSEEQMTYLEKALFFDNEATHETYLPKEDALTYWPRLFVLQARNKHFAEALTTYEVIKAIGADEAAASLADAVAQLRDLAVNDTAYADTGFELVQL
jgi:TonB family protein